MASNEESDAVTMDKMESLIQRMSDVLRNEIKALKSKMEVMNTKLDGNTVEMNERFAAVEERFVKSEAIMEATKEQIILVDNTMNERLTLVKDQLSTDIKSQISEARSEFHDVITTTNDRMRMLSDKVDKQLDEMKTRDIESLNKSVTTVTSRLDTFILRDFATEVRAVMRPSIESVYREVERIHATVTSIETTVNTIDTKHIVTPDHMHVYFKALQAEIVELKASQLAANTEAERVENRLTSNADPDVHVRSDRHESKYNQEAFMRLVQMNGSETIAFMRENADSPFFGGKTGI